MRIREGRCCILTGRFGRRNLIRSFVMLYLTELIKEGMEQGISFSELLIVSCQQVLEIMLKSGMNVNH